MDSQTFVYDVEKQLNENVFSRTGYTFTGWNTEENGRGDTYADKASVMLYKDIVLYAQWELNTYTVTFNANGGNGTMAEQTFEHGVEDPLNKNVFIRTGYTFAGWNTAANGSGTAYADQGLVTLTEGNKTLYAQWKANTYTVTFYANGGEGSMDSQTFVYDVEEPLNKNGFSRPDYTFVGWNTKADGTGKAYGDQASTTFDANTELFAQWVLSTYTVTFDANGGKGSMDSQTFTAAQEQRLNRNSFNRPGYTFEGWNTKADGTGVSYANGQVVTLTGSVTLYAQWKFIPIQLEPFTVRFDANGGEGVMETMTFYKGLAQKLPQNSFVREGYTFAGWTTEPDGKGYYYGDVWNITVSEDTVLYAQWKQNSPMIKTEYKIEIDGSKGTVTRQNATSAAFEELYIRYAVTYVIDGEPYMMVDLIEIDWSENQKGVAGTFGIPKVQTTGEISNECFMVTTDDQANVKTITDVIPYSYGMLIR